MGRKVAIVTGANRGIGYQVARILLQKFNGDVIVTARSTEKGKTACQALRSEGLNPIWHELDVTQSASVRMLLDFVKEHYTGIDVLINNAGVTFPKDCNLSNHRMAELMVQTNFKGTVSMLKHFLPLLRPHARVVILSSDLGKLSSLGEKLRPKFDLKTIQMHELEHMSDLYLAAVKAGLWSDYGWPDRILEAVSVFQNVLAHLVARDLQSDSRRNIVVNAGCPGWTATEQMKTYLDADNCLGGIKARTPSEVADDIVWLALLPSGITTPVGCVVHNKKVVDIGQ